MAVKSCVICGNKFNTMGSGKTCTEICSKENRRIQKKRRRNIVGDCPKGRTIEEYREHRRLVKLRRIEKMTQEQRDELRRLNTEKRKLYVRNRQPKEKEDEYRIKYYYRKKGINPDEELISIVSMRRSLFGSIRKAGE